MHCCLIRLTSGRIESVLIARRNKRAGWKDLLTCKELGVCQISCWKLVIEIRRSNKSNISKLPVKKMNPFLLRDVMQVESMYEC